MDGSNENKNSNDNLSETLSVLKNIASISQHLDNPTPLVEFEQSENKPPVLKTPVKEVEIEAKFVSPVEKNTPPGIFVPIAKPMEEDTNVPVITQNSPNSEDTFTSNGYNIRGRVVSADSELVNPKIIRFISALFHLMTFSYTTLTILLVGTVLALAITLNNAGAPGFLFLTYYPTIGILPILTTITSILFLYVGYKIRDGSRFSWTIAVIAISALPLLNSIGLPIASFPLIKLISVYAGSPEKPPLVPVVSIKTLSYYFSILLLFEFILILLLRYRNIFRFPRTAISASGKTSIIVLILLFFLPVISLVTYGYYDANTTDFGYSQTANDINFKMYYPVNPPGGRVYATKFSANDSLDGRFNAVKVIFDVPLPVLVQTGVRSPIVLREVKAPDDFILDKDVHKQDLDPGEPVKSIKISGAANHTGIFFRSGGVNTLWFLEPDNVLISVSSPTADSEELTQFAESLQKNF
jgi:hypothetical protein